MPDEPSKSNPNGPLSLHGTTPEEASQRAFAAKPAPPIKPVVLFQEYGLTLSNEGEDLIINVLCGRIGEYGVEFALNSEEREVYQKTGDYYVQKLAADVRHSPHLFATRQRRR
jgi:hypothetical protein